MASKVKIGVRRTKRDVAWTPTPDRIASVRVDQSLLEQLGLKDEDADVDAAEPEVEVSSELALTDDDVVDAELVEDEDATVPAVDVDTVIDVEPVEDEVARRAQVEAAALATGWKTATDRVSSELAVTPEAPAVEDDRPRPIWLRNLAPSTPAQVATAALAATVADGHATAEIPVATPCTEVATLPEPAPAHVAVDGDGEAVFGLGDELGLDQAPVRAGVRLGQRAKVAVAAGGVVLAVALGAVGYGLVDHHRESAAAATYDQTLSAAQAQRSESEDAAQSALATPLADLQLAVDTAGAALAASDGQVADDAVRQALQATLDEATTMLAGEAVVVYGEDIAIEGVAADRPNTVIELATATTPSATEVTNQATALAEATTAVTDAHAWWAFDSLTAAVQHGRDVVLAESAGRVFDAAVRQGLAAAITEADAVWATGVGGTSVAETLAAKTKVEDAAASVATAQGEWQAAEDARIAAEQSAAAAAAALVLIPRPKTRTTGGGDSPAPAPAPAPEAARSGRVTSLNITGVDSSSLAPGTVRFTVQVLTSGPASVSVRASVGGRSVTLSGSGGAGTYSGTVTGIPTGAQSWSVSAGGLSDGGSITVF